MFPKEMLFLEIKFCSTRVIFFEEMVCVLRIMCSLNRREYLCSPRNMFVFPKEMLFLGTNWSSAGVVFFFLRKWSCALINATMFQRKCLTKDQKKIK